MKTNFYALILLLVLAVAATNVNGQGCVAVKNMSSTSINWGDENVEGLQVSLNYRYFRSYKHFRGSHEETERVEQNTEVINNDNSVNLGLSYTFNKKWSATLIVPYVFIDRSSLYEHMGNTPGNPRYHTQAQGFGDVRLIGYYNSLGSYDKGALTLGLGVKAPTGNYHVKDQFHTKDGIVTKLVDQSIQVGDGGTGIITEFDFVHNINGNVFGYAQGMYMLSPRNTNGTKVRNIARTAAGVEVPKSDESSVPDQYMVRMGGRIMAHGLQISLGGRMECIPTKDLVGKSEGFRRPGYIISAEPSAFYTFGAHTVGFNFPVALKRNRTRSQLDIARGNDAEGVPYHGDAAFADWLLSVTYAYKLGK